MDKSRKYYMDMIKIFAIFMVIFNHSGETGFLAYQNATNIFIQIFQMIPSIICKTAVPLFFMCSGALLLGKEEDLKQLWKKRIIKYIVVIYIFTIIYYIFLSFRNQTPMDFMWILKTTYSSAVVSYSGSYWFLYSYVGFLIMLPLLRIIARNLNRELVMYLIIINTLVRGFLPIAEICLGMKDLGVNMVLITSDVFFYPFIGYYIEQCDFEEICSKRNIFILLGMSMMAFFASALFTWFYIYRGKPTEEYLTLFGMYLVISIFVACKWIFSKVTLHKGFEKWIAEIGSCTFGVYLIHGFIYTLIDDVLLQNGITITYGISWLRAIGVFAIGCVLVWAFRKIRPRKVND